MKNKQNYVLTGNDALIPAVAALDSVSAMLKEIAKEETGVIITSDSSGLGELLRVMEAKNEYTK